MRLWGTHAILNLLNAGKDAGWAGAMVLICVGTFAVSSMFVTRGFRKMRRPASVSNLVSKGEQTCRTS